MALVLLSLAQFFPAATIPWNQSIDATVHLWGGTIDPTDDPRIKSWFQIEAEPPGAVWLMRMATISATAMVLAATWQVWRGRSSGTRTRRAGLALVGTTSTATVVLYWIGVARFEDYFIGESSLYSAEPGLGAALAVIGIALLVAASWPPRSAAKQPHHQATTDAADSRP